MRGKNFFKASVKASGKVALCACALVITLMLAPLAFAGGFYLEVERPASSDASLKDVVLLVHPTGCHKPEDANLTATAEGIVNGERVSVPLQFTRTAKGVFAIKKQWGAEGAWVLAITGEYNKAVRGIVVELGARGDLPNYFNSNGKGFNARAVERKPTLAEIDIALQNVSGRLAKAARL